MAGGTSLVELRNMLKRAESEKQEISRQIGSLKSSTKKGCLIMIAFMAVGSWILPACVMHDAPSDIKSLAFWMFFIAYALVGCIFLFVITRERRNELDEKFYSACSKVRQIERECEELELQEQLKAGECSQIELERDWKDKADHLNYLEIFCNLFANFSVTNTVSIVEPAATAVSFAEKTLAAKKEQNTALRKKVSSISR